MSSFRQLMMRNKGGGGVEFKTSIYATGNAYMVISPNITTKYGFKIVGTLLDTTSTSFSYRTPTIVGFRKSSSNPTGWCNGSFLFIANSKQKYVRVGYGGGTEEIELINSDGTVIATDFSIEKKNLETPPTNNKCGLLADYFDYNNSFSNFLNNTAKVKQIIIYDGDTEVANLLPAIVNGESGMYDTVTETFYGNANSVGSLVCE